MIITIDGPAAAGKGTVSAYLADKYKLAYFDTGMVYRAVGLQMVLTENDVNDEDKAEQIAKELTFPKMIELSKRIKDLVDSQSQFPDWDKKDDIKANLKCELIILLDEFGYPPVTHDEAYQEIFEQAENFKKNL